MVPHMSVFLFIIDFYLILNNLRSQLKPRFKNFYHSIFYASWDLITNRLLSILINYIQNIKYSQSSENLLEFQHHDTNLLFFKPI